MHVDLMDLEELNYFLTVIREPFQPELDLRKQNQGNRIANEVSQGLIRVSQSLFYLSDLRRSHIEYLLLTSL